MAGAVAYVETAAGWKILFDFARIGKCETRLGEG